MKNKKNKYQKTPRINRNAKMLLQALIQIKLENKAKGDIISFENFRKELTSAISRVKGVPQSQLDEVIGKLFLNTEPDNHGKTFVVY